MATQITDNDQRYGFVSRALHWATAGLFVALVAMGWIDDDMPKPGEFNLMTVHISLGVAFLVLVGARIAWRLFQGWPEFRETGSRIIQRLSRWAHLALFGLMLALPVTGWAIVSAAGYDASFFGMTSLPDLLPVSHGLEDAAEEVHEVLVNVMLLLVGVHVLAALKHKYFDRDGVFSRML